MESDMTEETTPEVLENQESDLAPVDTADNAIESVADLLPRAPDGLPVIITPSIGRVVLFRPDAEFIEAKGLSLIDTALDDAQPLTAQIVYVHNNYKVNVAGFDQYGQPFTAVNVQLLTGNETEQPVGPYAHWMNYQLTQALREAAKA
jgi:hypothetical protein